EGEVGVGTTGLTHRESSGEVALTGTGFGDGIDAGGCVTNRARVGWARVRVHASSQTGVPVDQAGGDGGPIFHGEPAIDVVDHAVDVRVTLEIHRAGAPDDGEHTIGVDAVPLGGQEGNVAPVHPDIELERIVGRRVDVRAFSHDELTTTD